MMADKVNYSFGMSIKSVIYYIIILAVFVSCTDQEYVKSTFNKFPDRVKVESNEVYRSDMIAVPHDITYMDSLVIMRDADGPPFVHSYDLRNDKLYSFGERGEGPGKFMRVWEVDYLKDGLFRIFDAPTRRVFKCSISALLSNKQDICKREFRLSGDGTPLRVHLSVPGNIIATGLYNKRLAYYNDIGELYKLMHDIPDRVNVDKNISDIMKSRAYQAHLDTNPSKTKIAAASMYSDRLDIYNIEGKLLNTSIGPKGYVPHFRVIRTGNLAPTSETITSYVDVTTTKDNIYTLYRGLTNDEESNVIRESIIRVFDWSGKPQRQIIVNDQINSITIGEDKNTLYATSTSPYPAIVSINI